MTDSDHWLVEETSLALHRAVAERMRSDPALLAAARARVAGWLRSGGIARPLADAWAAVLDGSPDSIAAFMTDPGQRARDLRQTSPFAGALDPRARWQIWRRVRHATRP